jgi:hypothetical protein
VFNQAGSRESDDGGRQVLTAVPDAAVHRSQPTERRKVPTAQDVIGQHDAFWQRQEVDECDPGGHAVAMICVTEIIRVSPPFVRLASILTSQQATISMSWCDAQVGRAASALMGSQLAAEMGIWLAP